MLVPKASWTIHGVTVQTVTMLRQRQFYKRRPYSVQSAEIGLRNGEIFRSADNGQWTVDSEFVRSIYHDYMVRSNLDTKYGVQSTK